MKELEVYVVPASYYGGDQRVREMTVQVTQISSQQSRTARFTLPDSQIGNGPAWPVVRQVTDGHDPTEISLVLPMDVKVLRIQPGVRSASGISYALELAARDSAMGAGSDSWAVDQRQALEFPPDAGPRRVFEVSGPAPETPDGAPGPRMVGDIWALDMTAGPYGDRFRFSFRRPQGVTDRVDMGVSVLDALTGEPQGGETIPLAHTGALTVAMLANDGISAAIDLTGDGRADVQVFDRLTQPDRDHPGHPGVNRTHELQVLGSAVTTPWHHSYTVRDGTITAGRVHPHAEDLAAAENAAAFSGLDQQAGLTDAAAEIESLDLQLSQLREAAHRDGVIGDDLFQTWQTLSLGFVALRFARRQGAVPVELRDRLAAEARAFYRALSAETTRDGESHNPYTGSGDNGRVCIDAGANFAEAIRAGRWDDAVSQFRTMVRGMDRWIMERHRARYPSNVEGRPETQRAAIMEQIYGRRDLVSGIAHRNPTRIRAVYHPRAEFESSGRIAQVPLSLYFWRDDDGEDWIIKDCTTPQESPEYEGDGSAGQLEPSLTAMGALDNDDHFQAGFINYVMPSGAPGRVETTGPSRVIRWLTIAGVATAAIGLGLLTAGAGTAAVTFLGISGLIGATTAGIDLVQRSRTNTLTIRTAVLDVAQIAAGLAGGAGLVAGRIINGARLAAATGEAVQATAALRAANNLWVPLQITTGVADAAQGLVLAEGAYRHMQQIQDSEASEPEKTRALLTFLMEVAVTTGLVVLSVRGSSAEVFAGRPLSVEVVNGVHYAVPATRSVQGRAIDESRDAIESATAETAAVRQQEHLQNIRTTLPGREGEALASVEAMAMRPGAEGDLVADAAGNLTRADRPAGSLDDLVERVTRANNAGAAHGTGTEYRVVVEPAGAGGRSRVRVVAGDRALDAAVTAQQLVASTEGALQAAGPVTRRIRGLDPSVRIETTPGGVLRVEGHPDLDLPRLTRELGGAEQLDTLAGQLGAPLTRIASDLPGPEIVTLVGARGAPAVRWAGTELPGQRAQQLLAGLSDDVLRRCRLSVARGGVTPTQAETLLDVLTDANLQRCVGNVHMRELVPLVAQQERGAARGILEGYLNAGQMDNLRRFLRSAERAAAVELATPAAVGAADIIVDNQTLSSVRALMGGQTWANLQQIERRMVERLFDTLGSPLSAAAVAPTGGGPTQAELQGIMPRLRAPATVLGETGITARHRPPGGATIELGEVERPVGLEIGVERNSPEYRAILSELERPPRRPWTSAADVDPITGRTEAVGRPGGIRDRTVVADALFAASVPGGTQPPRFITADGAVFERLAGYAVGTVNPPLPGAGKVPARLARANPAGFEIDVLGRRLWVVPVGL